MARSICCNARAPTAGGSSSATGGDPGGLGLLITLALLNAGVPDADRDKLDRAIAFLRGLKPDTVYVRALQTMALVEASLDPKRTESARAADLELIRKNVQWLIDGRYINGGKLEGWGYKANDAMRNASTTQYAVLGLWAGKQAGIEVKREIWEQIRDYYVRSQDPDAGFWTYDPNRIFLKQANEFQSASITMTTLPG